MKHLSFCLLLLTATSSANVEAKENCTVKSSWTTQWYRGAIRGLFPRTDRYEVESFDECLELVEEAASNPRENIFEGVLGKEYPVSVKYKYEGVDGKNGGTHKDPELSGVFKKSEVRSQGKETESFKVTVKGTLCASDMVGSCACPNAHFAALEKCESAGFKYCIPKSLKPRYKKKLLFFESYSMEGKCTAHFTGTDDELEADRLKPMK